VSFSVRVVVHVLAGRAGEGVDGSDVGIGVLLGRG